MRYMILQADNPEGCCVDELGIEIPKGVDEEHDAVALNMWQDHLEQQFVELYGYDPGINGGVFEITDMKEML